MSFINTQYLPFIFIGFVLFFFIVNRFNSKYFDWVESYWFLKRSFTNRLSSFLYYLSMLLLMLSLLDLRGPEKKVKGNLPDQKTIIIIDTSLSMLSEDVRPNRFGKALQLARHFVKNSAGHQLAIVVFSDTQKRLIPFTDDIDLVDSRLAALETTNSVGGGSNISQAISEATAYFEESSEDGSGGGNILLFTDAEESDGDFKISVPDNVNLAVIGIGTAKGGNIPLRWEDGSYRGYKTVKNEPVVTKLNEDYIKSLGKSVKNYAYWIVNSYTLPTEEILNFLRAKYNKSHSNGDLRIRPVYSYLILIPAILIYVVSVLVGRFKTFRSISSIILVLFLFNINFLRAEEKAESKLPGDVVSDLEKMKSGKSSHLHTLKTAEKLLRNNKNKEALEIYSEYLSKNDDEKARFNYATSLLKEGKYREGMSVASELLKNSKDEVLKNKLRSNLLVAINQKKENQKGDNKKNQDQKSQENQQNNQQNNQDQKDNKDQDQKNNKDQNQNSNKQDKQDQNQKDNKDQKQTGKENPQNNQGKPQNNGDKKEEDKKEDNKDKKENDKKKEKGKEGEEDKQEQEENKGPQSLEEKEKQIEQKRRMTKLPGVVKQLMNDDRELQKKLMDTSTKEKGDLKPKNDW